MQEGYQDMEVPSLRGEEGESQSPPPVLGCRWLQGWGEAARVHVAHPTQSG